MRKRGIFAKFLRVVTTPTQVWYLQHFLIVKLSKSTMKLRIVFDCSTTYDGISLNDVIHAGPKLQRELFGVLFHYRHNPVAFVCDIKEMYLPPNPMARWGNRPQPKCL